MSSILTREYPRYAIVAVGAVLLRDNEILLVKRGYPPGKGKWSIPGGVVEAGEDIYSAAIRELKEETGIEAIPLGVVWICNNVVKDDLGKVQYHYVILDVLFDDKSINGSLKAGGDAVDVAWFPTNAVMKKDDVSRTVKNLIERINKFGLTYISL
ncbi:MAG: NUDIX hydrolase [Sulfolobales archaeon]|nr:NUDIX hydrolase [Sulfolobales archaeon]